MFKCEAASLPPIVLRKRNDVDSVTNARVDAVTKVMSSAGLTARVLFDAPGFTLETFMGDDLRVVEKRLESVFKLYIDTPSEARSEEALTEVSVLFYHWFKE